MHSAERLLEHVWDEHADPFTNTVRVTLSNLRSKLTAAGAADVIETLPGRGYRLRRGMTNRRGTLRWRLALGMTALALVTAALVGLFGFFLGGWLGYDPEPVTVTRVEQVGDRVALVQITSDNSTATADRARRDGVRWMLTAMAVSFVPAAALAWLVAGTCWSRSNRSRMSSTGSTAASPTNASTSSLATTRPGRLATGVDHMLDRLDARRDEQRRLFHEVVHELRTPLAVATMNLSRGERSCARGGDIVASRSRSSRDRPHGPHRRRSLRSRAALTAGRGDFDYIAKEAHALASEHAAPASTRGVRIEVVAPPTLPVTADRAAVRSAGRELARQRRSAGAHRIDDHGGLWPTAGLGVHGGP